MVNELVVSFPQSFRQVLISEVIMIMTLLSATQAPWYPHQNGQVLSRRNVNNSNGHEVGIYVVFKQPENNPEWLFVK